MLYGDMDALSGRLYGLCLSTALSSVIHGQGVGRMPHFKALNGNAAVEVRKPAGMKGAERLREESLASLSMIMPFSFRDLFP